MTPPRLSAAQWATLGVMGIAGWTTADLLFCRDDTLTALERHGLVVQDREFSRWYCITTAGREALAAREETDG